MGVKRKVCIVTGARSDYGLLKSLMRECQRDKTICLQLIATGMHMSKKYGLTYRMIEKDGFNIDAKVPILNRENTPKGVTRSIGTGCGKFADVFSKLNPDIIVLLGDRFEMLSASIAAYMSRIPIAHIHGGEVTEGVTDEGVRHSISKMAAIHFTSTEAYRRRLIQMGEDPKRVFYVGAPGLDGLANVSLYSHEELNKVLGVKWTGPTAICTFHPLTLSKNNVRNQILTVLSAIKATGINAIFTQANADPGGEIINSEVGKFCMRNPERYHFFDNLGQKKYYSCLKWCDVMVGNSSSGLIEAASFSLPAVNIGDRQKSRIRGKNVIDVPCSKNAIMKAIKRSLAPSFRKTLREVRNPYQRYSDGRASFRIKEKIKTIPLNGRLTQKSFYDVAFRMN